MGRLIYAICVPKLKISGSSGNGKMHRLTEQEVGKKQACGLKRHLCLGMNHILMVYPSKGTN